MSGIDIIKEQLKTMPTKPGIYRMLDEKNEVLYVGKAKNLKKRIISYTNLDKLVPRMRKMVMATSFLEIVTTRTEAEALLLESNLIKSLKPKYNILLRDDKSFPYITLTNHEYPRIAKHRGEKKKGEVYYGPFAAAGDVNRAITALQKAFLVRPCSDSVFSGRSRPCLEYQIKRCSAPCVGKVSKGDYIKLVKQVEGFLSGKSREVQDEMRRNMEAASNDTDYEKAAIFRDRIKALTHIQSRQNINTSFDEADVIAIHQNGLKTCVQVFFVRAGQTLGNKAYFPSQTEGFETEEILEAFLGRFYHDNSPAKNVILSHDIYGKKVFEEAYKTKVIVPLKGEKRQLVEIVLANAKDELERRENEDADEKEMLEKVAKLFGIDEEIKRIEVYDNSHIFGKYSVGAMIVSGEGGFIKNAYRRFNVDAGEKATGGDDYHMLRQVLTRRFGKIKLIESENIPDLILIDGGAGQLSVTEEVFADLGIGDIPFVCIAKGPERNAGREDFYLPGKKPFKLEKNDPVLYYLQRLRDEAHRFAIFSHRSKRAKSITKSVLDEIPGIGVKRKKALLNHFGSSRGVEQAGLEELAKAPGISKKVARKIYDYLSGGV